MKHIILMLFYFISLYVISHEDEAILEEKLSQLQGVTYTKISTGDSSQLKYYLKIRQPIDHLHPEHGSFIQYAILLHKSLKAPTVMNTEGYFLYTSYNEVENIFGANNLSIEHRYFGRSLPDSVDWSQATYENVAADLHHIRRLFDDIYTNKWISTGISRGGQTAIIYKYFYPDDVDLVIPYVAPITLSPDDPRTHHFLDTIGSTDCRQKIKDIQVYLLKNEKKIIASLKNGIIENNYTFNYLGGVARAYEIGVLELPFAFWQAGVFDCDDLLKIKKRADYAQFFTNVTGFDFLHDNSIEELATHYYMASAYSGYYGYDVTPFKDYLKHVTENTSASFYPKDAGTIVFKGELIHKINDWAQHEANNILYIYGGQDTWTSCKVTPDTILNSTVFILPNANHYSARIKNMEENMKLDFSRKVDSMIGLNVDFSDL